MLFGILKWFMKFADSKQYAMYKPQKNEESESKELLSLNKDIIGWIDVFGTKIDYPILQGKDNHKYLNTTVKNEYSTAGSIFLDFRNSKTLDDLKISFMVITWLKKNVW